MIFNLSIGIILIYKNFLKNFPVEATTGRPLDRPDIFIAISTEYIIMYINVGIGAKKIHLRHPERNAVESKDLRTEYLHSSNDNA